MLTYMFSLDMQTKRTNGDLRFHFVIGKFYHCFIVLIISKKIVVNRQQAEVKRLSNGITKGLERQNELLGGWKTRRKCLCDEGPAGVPETVLSLMPHNHKG